MKLEVNILELNKLPKNSDHTKKLEWLKFINSESEVEMNMIAEKNVQIKKAYSILQELSEDEVTINSIK